MEKWAVVPFSGIVMVATLSVPAWFPTRGPAAIAEWGWIPIPYSLSSWTAPT